MITISIIVVFVLLFLLIEIRIHDRISRLLILIYVIYWCLSLLVTRINFMNFYVVHDDTYWILLAHVITFVCGYILIRPYSFLLYKGKELRVYKGKGLRATISIVLNNWLFKFLFSFCLIFILYSIFKARELLYFYTFSEVKHDFIELVLGDSGLLAVIYNFIVWPMFHFSLAIMSYMLFFDFRWKCIALLFLYIVCCAILTGGRNQFMTIGYYIMSMWILSTYISSRNKGFYSKYVFSTKLKLLILVGAFFLLTSMTIISIFRAHEDKVNKELFINALNDLGNRFVTYSSGPIVAFDISVHNNSFYKKKYYGMATFSGTFRYIGLLAKHLGITTNLEEANKSTARVLQENKIYISSDHLWNYAYTSCVYYFYDFGLLGVLIFPFLLGLIVRRIICIVYIKYNIFIISLFLFICFCMYMSVFSGILHKIQTVFYIVLLLLLSNLCSERKSKIYLKF